MEKEAQQPTMHIVKNSIYGKLTCEKPYSIGMHYKPYDNSYCKNTFTEEPAVIVQQDMDFPDHDYYGPDKCEDGAIFTIIKLPHHDLNWDATINNNDYSVFVHVKSSLTGIVYRTLYKRE